MSVNYTVLKRVETVVKEPNATRIKKIGCDNSGNEYSVSSKSIELGPIAPGETSNTKIIYLQVPSGIAINNIKIGLIDTGGIAFSNQIFGIETYSYLDYNIIPTTYFSGVNSLKTSDSVYNVSVPNNGQIKSQYVYLNVILPVDFSFISGTIRYKWFFDFNNGI